MACWRFRREVGKANGYRGEWCCVQACAAGLFGERMVVVEVEAEGEVEVENGCGGGCEGGEGGILNRNSVNNYVLSPLKWIG